ncbi:MAG: hypothetical protein Q7T01_02495 [bacterium]|nr:hypothetical protein [bacterium]
MSKRERMRQAAAERAYRRLVRRVGRRSAVCGVYRVGGYDHEGQLATPEYLALERRRRQRQEDA